MATSALPKLNVAPMFTVPLALAHVGWQVAAQLMGKHDVAGKLTAVKGHSLVEKVNSKKELLLAILGLVLVFHGAHFKNLLLCSQVVMAFLYDRVKSSVADICGDIQTARQKILADAPDTAGDKKKEASAEAKRKEDAEAAKKALKALNSEKLSSAAVEVLGSLMACVLVVHGGLARKVAIAYSLVSLLGDKVEALLEFPGHSDIKPWTSLFVRFALYAVVLPLTFLSGSLALAMDAAACGGQLATEHGVRFLASIGKVPDADAFLCSKNGFIAVGGFVAFGTVWQFWSLAAESGLGYLTVLYLPAVLAEAIVGFVAGGSD